jgi:hypothetical protein
MRISTAAALTTTLFLSSPALAEAPKAILEAAPPLPGDACNTPLAEQDAFLKRVTEAQTRVREETKRRTKQRNAATQTKQPQVEANMIAEAGMSSDQAALAARMLQLREQAKGASGAERDRIKKEQKKLAGEMMEAQSNVSMDEAKAVKKQSKEARQQWSQAMSTEAMAVEMARSSEKPSGKKGSRIDGDRAGELAEQLMLVSEKLEVPHERVTEKLAELEADPSGIATRQEMEEVKTRIGKLRCNSGGVIQQGQQMKPECVAAFTELEKLQASYCARLGTRQVEAFREYLAGIKGLAPDYARQDDLKAELFEATTGTTSPEEAGTKELEEIGRYLAAIRAVFKYDVRAKKI